MELSAKEPSSKRAWRIVRICDSRDAVHPILLLQSLMVDKLFSGIGNIATQWILSLAGDRPGVQNILFAHYERPPPKFDVFSHNVVRCKMAKKHSHRTETKEF